ncbi:MAG TPA: cupin domain-containing protein [Thermoanaerobaculia bacterium]|nr:cupin domain-containing protein [Thermoanaerobaculia bacterium]
MTIRRLFRCSLPLLAILSLCFCASGLSAQDAEKASPKVVKLKLENERVRVLEAVSNPGDKENMHSHPANIVYVVEGGKLRITTPDGKSKDVEFKTGDTLWREPVTHAAENIGTTRVHVIIVELKQH